MGNRKNGEKLSLWILFFLYFSDRSPLLKGRSITRQRACNHLSAGKPLHMRLFLHRFSFLFTSISLSLSVVFLPSTRSFPSRLLCFQTGMSKFFLLSLLPLLLGGCIDTRRQSAGRQEKKKNERTSSIPLNASLLYIAFLLLDDVLFTFLLFLSFSPENLSPRIPLVFSPCFLFLHFIHTHTHRFHLLCP